MITVRRAAHADREKLFEFIKLAYPTRWKYKIPERWQWEYVDNPFLTDDLLPVFIAVEEDGTVVGQTCSLVEPLKLGSTTVRVGWSVDTFLLPEYRGQGIGFQLQKINDESNPVFMSLSMSNQNRRIKAGLGSVPLEPVMMYSRLARYTPESIRAAGDKRLARVSRAAGRTVSSAMRLTLADRAAAGALNWQLSLRDRSELAPADPGITFMPVDHFGEEVDRLWESVSPCFYAAVPRTSEYLNWKYVRQPFARYTRLAARRGRDICGYLVLRVGQPPERKVGILADFLVHPDDEKGIRTLLAQAVKSLTQAGAKDISAATTVSAYQKAFEDLGFHAVKEYFPMFHCKLDEAVCSQAVEPGSWLLGRGDHDWDQVPLGQ